MKVIICDETLREVRKQKNFDMSFKEMLEVAKHLDELNVDIIGVGPIVDEKTDSILFRTISTFLKNSMICCSAFANKKSIDLAYNAIKDSKNKAISIGFPTSTMQMEYVYNKKPEKMLELINETITYAVSLDISVEAVFEDATRAEEEFLYEAINIALKAGAKHISIVDSVGVSLPAEFRGFVEKIKNRVKINSFGIGCNNTFDMGNACVFSSVDLVTFVKTSIFGYELPKLENLCKTIYSLGDKFNLSMSVDSTKISQIVKVINKERDSAKASITQNETFDNVGLLDKNVTRKELNDIVAKLGYDISSDDQKLVYDTFLRLANKKEQVKLKELDVIVANVAMQVPATYVLETYVINSGNIIRSTASIVIRKNDELLYGLSYGDGPIDSAFRAVAQIMGHEYELDDFRIKSATSGTEAIGEALIKIRYNGKLYSGSGISTDINGASIRAYIAAVNKIVYESDE